MKLYKLTTKGFGIFFISGKSPDDAVNNLNIALDSSQYLCYDKCDKTNENREVLNIEVIANATYLIQNEKGEIKTGIYANNETCNYIPDNHVFKS